VSIKPNCRPGVHVDVPLRQRLCDLARTSSGPGQVAGHDLRLASVRPGEFVRQDAQFVLAASDEYQIRAITGE
jgi:hypothetical protein